MTPAEMRSYLRTYKTNLKEIIARAKHLEWLKKEVYFPLVDTPDLNDKVLTNARSTMLKIVTEMQGEIDELERKNATIEKIISLLKGDERTIIYARYVLGASWLDVPLLLNYEIAHCQRIERRAILNLLKIKKSLPLLW